MTEAELILGSLTPEELDDANRYTSAMIASWRVQTKIEQRSGGLHGTDGPFHALSALRLAILREMTQRGGAEPWFVGMSTEGHIAGRVLDLYGRRYGYRELEARPGPGGQLERLCVVCGERKPQAAEHFERPDGLWSDICRACHRADPERYKDALEFTPVPPAPTETELLELL